MTTLTFWSKIASVYFTVLSFSFAEFTLTILHTNDIHCRFEETDKQGSMCRAVDRQNNECYGGVARRATAIDEIRSNGGNVLLLDGGDQLTGTLWYRIFKGNASASFMNDLKYDAVTFGNHDFDGGVEHTISYLKQLKVPVVLSNVNVTDEKKWPNPNLLFNTSLVVDVGDQKVGICGYLLPKTSILSYPGTNIVFNDEVESVRNCAQQLKRNGINKIIALGHSGIAMDKRIAREVQDVDIVVGGHSNTFLYSGTPPSNDKPFGNYPLVIEKTGSSKKALVVQAYAYGKYLGHLNTVFDNEGNLVRWSGNPTLLDEKVRQKASIMVKLAAMKQEVDKIGKVKIGQTNVLLDSERNPCRLGECVLGNLITNAVVFDSSTKNSNLNHWTNASIALWTGNSIMASIDINKTDYILYEDVLNSFPYANIVDVIEIRGSDIVTVLEQSVAKYASTSPMGNFLQMSGIKVTYDLTKPPSHRISSLEVRCAACRIPKYEPLINSKVYKVIMSNYMAKGGAGYSVFRTKRLRYYPGNQIDIDIILKYIKAKTPLTLGLDGRIRFIKSSTKNVGCNIAGAIFLLVCSYLIQIYIVHCVIN